MAGFGLFLNSSKNVMAANSAAFMPGRIIDDQVFNDTSNISSADVQGFLNFQVPNCDTGHVAGTGAQGAVPPWICLKNYSEGGRSAAQIIVDAGNYYNINPRVLIATLQKETGLVTDTWPYPWQYRTAMGMGCPDGAPCDSQYFGLTNQIYQAARHLRNFQLQNPNWTIPHRIGLNSIKWSPDAGCGTSQVNIENGATSALYSYTPYRPNQAALGNLYGSGDGCSSYGNRNFWRYYTDWFGSTLATNYDYQFVSASQSSLTMGFDQPRNGNTIVLKNTGAKTWYADGNLPVGERPVRLKTRNYQPTPFADNNDPSWLGTSNQIRLATPAVQPGETGVFIFNVKGPYQHIFGYPNDFIPIVDGVTSMKDKGLRFLTSTSVPTYNIVSAVSPPGIILNNQKVTAGITIKNTSQSAWYGDGSVPAGKRPMRLVSIGYKPVVFADPTDSNWLNTNSQIKMSQAVVNPGENATFTFNLIGPFSYRYDLFKFVPAIDGTVALADIGMQFRLISPQPIYSYSGVTATNPPSTMAKGAVTTTKLNLRNTSNFTWTNEVNKIGGAHSVRLIMTSPFYRSSPFFDVSDSAWLNPAQITMETPIVNPGEIATFSFRWKAPNKAGIYFERFVPAVDGAGALPDLGMGFLVNVQ
jgi:hypothetical protein